MENAATKTKRPFGVVDQAQEAAWQRQKEDCYARWRDERIAKAVDWLHAAKTDQSRIARKRTLETAVSRKFAANAWAAYWDKWRNTDAS